MPKLISGDQLRDAVISETFIRGGDPDSVENVKYDFHMGSRVLKAAYARPIELSDIPADKRFVDPGEAVFVLSKEKLNLPSNIMATLSQKRKLAHGGIIILGGLTVDPLYQGFLVVGLYNFSSTPFPLQADKKLIAALFYELDPNQVREDAPVPTEISDFPDELIALIRNYRPVELNGLDDQIRELSLELKALKADLTSDKTWRESFKSGLEAHNSQIDKLLKSLEEEKQNRVSEDEKIKQKLENMSNTFYGLSLVKKGLVALLLIALGALAAMYIPKLLGESGNDNQSVESIQPPPTTRSPA